MTEHISEDQLLELRAGLLDDAPQQVMRIQKHISDCEECSRKSAELDSLFALTEDVVMAEPSLEIQLRKRRALAYQNAGEPRQRSRYWSIAASLLVVVGAVYVVSQQEYNSVDGSHGTDLLAGVEPAEVEELMTSVDFFLWMDEVEDQEKL